MAMPPDTPTPCMVKLIERDSRRRWSPAVAAHRQAGFAACASPRAIAFGVCRRGRASFRFAEAAVDEVDQRIHGFLLALAAGFQGDRAAVAGGQHHDAHDAFGIDAAFVALYPDVTRKLAGGLRQACRGAGMQPELVDDLYLSFNHVACRLPR